MSDKLLTRPIWLMEHWSKQPTRSLAIAESAAHCHGSVWPATVYNEKEWVWETGKIEGIILFSILFHLPSLLFTCKILCLMYSCVLTAFNNKRISINQSRATWRQRTKYLDSLGTCWPNNITLLEPIKATEDRELLKHVTADVVFDTAPWGWGGHDCKIGHALQLRR